ncbi:MAG TPA: nitrilase-related carbon-nitrogen hydrolase [Candidatus Dormibacteraeota bacterium]|nr:nitrilase-related carbon-nitrogen hydrolase [Candidatus Dormibacteraeota bacterium]
MALVQDRWHGDCDAQQESLAQGARLAAGLGAELICLAELTLSPYFATTADGERAREWPPEPADTGPTFRFASRLAVETGCHVQASLYEAARDAGLGYNTAICVAPDGQLVAATRKAHLPVTAGYYEDRYFRPGDSGTPVHRIGGVAVGFPTCWDQWFPELARLYALAAAELLVFPTAIGSEPDHPGFDTAPLWETAMRGHAITNGLFIAAVNRIGTEDGITFYGSSFISDPYGRVLAQAGRAERAVVVANIDPDQRRDWLELFPFLTTRRPELYGPLAGAPAR